MKFEPLNFWDLKCSEDEMTNLVKLVENKDLSELVILRHDLISEIEILNDELLLIKGKEDNEDIYYEKMDYVCELSDKINYLSHIISNSIEKAVFEED